MKELRAGQRVRIDGTHSWSVGRVEELRRPEHLPEISGAPAVDAVTAIMREWGVTRVAMISHAGLLFAALETATGWCDLRRQPLKITPVDFG